MKRFLQACLVAAFALAACHAHAQSEDQGRTRRAAEGGNRVAQFFMGLHYYEGFGGVSKDRTEAARWWLKSAEQSFPDAEMAIGDLYYKGEGVSQDYASAFKWFRRAALHGESMSCVRIATMYMKSQAVSQDLVQAYAWLSLYRPSDEKGRTKQRQFLSVLENKLSSSQLAKAQTLADELRAEIRETSK